MILKKNQIIRQIVRTWHNVGKKHCCDFNRNSQLQMSIMEQLHKYLKEERIIWRLLDIRKIEH